MKSFFTALVAAQALFFCSLSQAATLSPVQTITQGGHQRTFYYYKPDNFDPSKGILVWLHAGGSNGQTAATDGTDGLWLALADRIGVLVIFPEGKASNNNPDGRTWNSCADAINTTDPTYTDWDDVGFIKALIPWATSNISASLDTTRSYAGGHSEGSKMAERLALEANDTFAAVGVVSGNLPVANDNGAAYKCSGYTSPWAAGTSQAVPVFLFKGNMDPRIPYGATSGVDHDTYCQIKDGGSPPCASGAGHSYYDTVAFWQWKLGISTAADAQVAPATTTNYPNTVPACGALATCDGSQVTRYAYGAAPYRLVFEKVINGGHQFPGPNVETQDEYNAGGWKNRDALGQPNPYIAEEMWAFLTQFTLSN